MVWYTRTKIPYFFNNLANDILKFRAVNFTAFLLCKGRGEVFCLHMLKDLKIMCFFKEAFHHSTVRNKKYQKIW